MKKITYILFLLICSLPAFAQGEANNWYFGRAAGIKFMNDGSVSVLSDSMIDTNEGCSSISDSEGNLLFYTDGRNVWDRNHVLMPNANIGLGTGLLGDPSSTQSGIIVPKKGDPNIYYIFTVDEPHQENAAVYPNQFPGPYPEPNGTFGTIPLADDGFNNGLNYSIVDLSITGANGSIGDITTRNVHLQTYDPSIVAEASRKCSEKITAIKNSDGTGFWVITHFIDKFYSFSVDENGVNATPVITQIAPVVSAEGYRRNAIGCIKASPDGKKLAIAHMQRATVPGATTSDGTVFLYDLDDATGVVSNPVQVAINISPYGVEFSPQVNKLYVSFDSSISGSRVMQYDLLSPNIPGSGVIVGTTLQASTLQLGPNGKIYRASVSSSFLDVINDPDEDGVSCNFQPNAINLGSGLAIFGLPPFITSLLSANILAGNNCLGEATQFGLSIIGNFDTIDWDFGDGSPHSADLNPVHTYATAGTFTVTATISRDGESTQVATEITVSPVPVANTAPAMTECDPDNNGSAVFNLSRNNSFVLDTQSSSTFDVKYFASQANADAGTQPLNTSAHTNTTNPETVFVRIFNKENPACYATTSFPINVSNTPTLNGSSFAICDDLTDGDDANGLATFNLDVVTAQLVQNPAQFTTTYYASEPNAQVPVNPLPQNFTTTTPGSQVVYARIVNNAFAGCFTIEPITLTVNPLPPVVNNAALIQCDLGVAPDGFTQFNLTEADASFTLGSADMAVSYFTSDANAGNDANAITGPFTNTSNPQQLTVKVLNNITGCFRLQALALQVNMTSVPAITLSHCDDDGTEDGFYNFTLTDAGLENPTSDVVYYASVADALQEANAINSSFTNTVANRQSVFARIENNNNCAAIQEIILLVNPLPDIDIEDESTVCVNTGDFITLDAGANGNTTGYLYTWSNGAATPTISVNQPGTYTVVVKNANGCEKTRTITVAPSDVAVIDTIDIVDLTNNNTVTVFASPTGNVATTYLYSLDLPDGPFQESNFFENVPAGIHTVYVYDDNGCGIVSEEIAVLEIPKFFTPNGDGVNDTWRIVGVNAVTYSNSSIMIFDRYGKLLASVPPNSTGWDGLYNGQALPATDYWYVVSLSNGRVVRGHFSMVR